MADEPGLDAYPKLQGHILSRKEFGPLLRSRARAKHQAEWRDLIRALAAMPPSSAELAERFHTQWHVCHHFLRELVAGGIGTAWRDKLETADMFAQGLNAVGKGGVILRTLAPAAAIIAGPSWHSAQWLGESEFPVDTAKLGKIQAVARFKPSH